MLKRLAIVVSLVLLVSVPAFAGHYHGIRVTPTSINPSTNVVDVDITVWMDNTESSPYYLSSVFWGDGESSHGLTLPLTGSKLSKLLGQEEAFNEGTTADWFGEDTIYGYRRSLSHTYETDGQNFTIRVLSYCCNANESLYAGTDTGGGGENASAQTIITAAALPTLPPTGLIVLALGLVGLGAIMLRRTATS